MNIEIGDIVTINYKKLKELYGRNFCKNTLNRFKIESFSKSGTSAYINHLDGNKYDGCDCLTCRKKTNSIGKYLLLICISEYRDKKLKELGF